VFKSVPSTIHPPGKRNTPGLMSNKACAKSFLKPFSCPFHVSTGKRDTCSKSIVPLDAKNIRKVDLSSVCVGFKMTWYFFHSFESIVSSSEANACLSAFVLGFTISILIFSEEAPSGKRAHTLKRYSSPAFTPIPKKPSFSNPVRLWSCPG